MSYKYDANIKVTNRESVLNVSMLKWGRLQLFKPIIENHILDTSLVSMVSDRRGLGLEHVHI